MIELVELCKEMVRLHHTAKEWSTKTVFSVVIVRKMDLVFLQPATCTSGAQVKRGSD